ncbi:MAG: Gfo/Idh/MocA family oxidoreductase [Candidatus Sumerlaeaceae bacterium]
MSTKNILRGPQFMTRREFLLATAATSAGLALAAGAGEETTPTATDETEAEPEFKGQPLNIALIGAGLQGRVLLESCLHIPGIHIKAVCDVWEYSSRYASRMLKKYNHIVNVYEDYQEMLAKEKELNAVVIASPDFMHAPHTNACLKAGLHVYCEKEMSNTLAGAQSMVNTARETKKLLQIGHQRRSNPRYLHAVKLMREKRLLGRLNHANAQWNRAKSDDFGWPDGSEISKEKLEKYGYASMNEFRNWRWYKKYGGGPIVDLGSHQIDVFNWVFGGGPTSVLAGGGCDYYKGHEWYDNVMAIFEYPSKAGTARAFYQVLTTTSQGQFFETFMGDEGALVLSEVMESGNSAWPEAHAPSWVDYAAEGLLIEGSPAPASDAGEVAVDARATQAVGSWILPVYLAKPVHQPHLENFFDAIRNGTPLNCPAEVGYECAVTVLKVNEAVEAARKLEYKPEEFQV